METVKREATAKIDRLNVRITPAERAQLERVALARGKTLSQVVLDLVEREARMLHHTIAKANALRPEGRAVVDA